LHVTAGQYEAASGVERLYERVEVAEYYSASADHEAPAIRSVRRAPAGGEQALTVEAEDASGVLAVVATWTEGTGAWTSVELAPGGGAGTWTARLPAVATVVVQAVDRAGNVAVDYHLDR
jgi:hypothetical protein